MTAQRKEIWEAWQMQLTYLACVKFTAASWGDLGMNSGGRCARCRDQPGGSIRHKFVGDPLPQGFSLAKLSGAGCGDSFLPRRAEYDRI